MRPLRRDYRTVFALCVCALALEASGQTLTRGPYLQLATPTSTVVRWRTDIPADAVVEFGTQAGSPASSVSAAAYGTDHALALTGLRPSTRYYYSVGSSAGTLAGGDTSHSFVTAPESGGPAPTRVWVVGDSGTANSNARAVRDAYLEFAGARPADLWLMLGDNAYPDGTDNQYQAAVFDLYPDILRQTPLWPTLGNHDGHTADSATQSGPYYDIFTLPVGGEAGGLASGTEAYYSFDYGNIHFVCLESYETDRSSSGAMMTWLENDLAATDQSWIIAFWHHPPYTKGSHDSDTESALVQMRNVALPILESHGVDLVLTGHSHSYERSFLLDGHYGVSGTLASSMVVDAGDGREYGDGSYTKPGGAGAANEGAVYAVAGSSGKVSAAPLNHPAMFVSMATLGSMVLDVHGERLDASFVDAAGQVRDQFTLIKGVDRTAPVLWSSRATDSTTVSLVFSEPLEEISATHTGGYAIAPDTDVIGAALSSDGRVVTLNTSALAPGQQYDLTVTGVEDRAGNPVAPGTAAAVVFVPILTTSFENGVSPGAGYAGVRDTYISQSAPASNFGSDVELLVDSDDPSRSGRDLSTLLAWDISSVPAGAIVESAQIEIDVTNPTGGSYPIYALLQSWSESGASWAERAPGSSWGAAGASGTSDRGTTVLGSAGFDGGGRRTVSLNASGVAVVQGWIDGSSPNHGLIIAAGSSSDGMDFQSSQASSGRPRLTITYSLPGTRPPAVPTGLTVASLHGGARAIDVSGPVP